MPICPNCGSSLPCTCACSAVTIRIIYDVDERKIESLMKDALRAENNGRPDAAIRYYKEVIEEIDGDSDYSSVENEAREAIENIRNAKRYSDESWKLSNNYEDEKALVLIDIALSYNRNNPNDWNRKGIYLDNLGRFDEALECYDKAQEIKMDDVTSKNKATMFNAWAEDLAKKGHYENAKRTLDEALQIFKSLDEPYEDTLNLKVNILSDYTRKLQENNDFERAREINTEALQILNEIDWDDQVKGRILSDEALNLAESNEYEKAQKTINEAIFLFERKGDEYYKSIGDRKEYGYAFYVKAKIYEKAINHIKAMMYYLHASHIYSLNNEPFERFKEIWKNTSVPTLETQIRLYESEKPINQEFKDKEAEMLYDLAFTVRIMGYDKMSTAVKLCNLGIRLLSENNYKKINRFKELIVSINDYKASIKEYDESIEYLKRIKKSDLITITGTQFQDCQIEFRRGMALRLTKEPENIHDHDAVAVYADEKKVGYVANSGYTASEMTSMASDIKEDARAEYLMMHDGKHIAHIIR